MAATRTIPDTQERCKCIVLNNVTPGTSSLKFSASLHLCRNHRSSYPNLDCGSVAPTVSILECYPEALLSVYARSLTPPEEQICSG